MAFRRIVYTTRNPDHVYWNLMFSAVLRSGYFSSDVHATIFKGGRPIWSFLRGRHLIKLLILFVCRKDRDIIEYRIDGIVVGRFIWSESLRRGMNPTTGRPSINVFATRVIRGLGLLASRFEEGCEGIFLEHAVYLNGIVCQLALRRNIAVVVDINPFPPTILKPGCGLFGGLPERSLSFQSQLVRGSKEFLDKEYFEPANAERELYYMHQIPENKKTENFRFLDQVQFVVAAHSFSDAEFMFGDHGFCSYYDWLCKTLDIAVRCGFRIFVRPHPNFYLGHAKYSVLDRQGYEQIQAQYASYTNIIFGQGASDPSQFLAVCKDRRITIITLNGSIMFEATAAKVNVFGSPCSLMGINGWLPNNRTYNGARELENLMISQSARTFEDLRLPSRYLNILKRHKKLSSGRDSYLSILAENYSLSVKEVATDPYQIDKLSDTSLENSVIERFADSIRLAS